MASDGVDDVISRSISEPVTLFQLGEASIRKPFADTLTHTDTYHIITFFLYRRYELTKLLQTIGYHLLVVGLGRADALKVELVQTLGQGPLCPGQICKRGKAEA